MKRFLSKRSTQCLALRTWTLPSQIRNVRSYVAENPVQSKPVDEKVTLQAEDSDKQEIKTLSRDEKLHRLRNALLKPGFAHTMTKKEFSQLVVSNDIDEADAEKVLVDLAQEGQILYYPNSTMFAHAIILKPDAIMEQLSLSIKDETINKELEKSIRALQALLPDLLKLQQQKSDLDARARRKLRFMGYGAAAYLSAQMAMFARLTWYDFGWDVMEPFTFFTTFTCFIGGYIYFMRYKGEYTYEHAIRHMQSRTRGKLYVSNKFDIDSYERSVKRAQQLETRIRDLFMKQQGMIPPEVEQIFFKRHTPVAF